MHKLIKLRLILKNLKGIAYMRYALKKVSKPVPFYIYRQVNKLVFGFFRHNLKLIFIFIVYMNSLKTNHICVEICLIKKKEQIWTVIFS